MPITRRQFLAAATLSTAALSPPLRALAGSATTLYDKSIVIDALGGLPATRIANALLVVRNMYGLDSLPML